MKVDLTVTMDDGTVLKGTADLSQGPMTSEVSTGRRGTQQIGPAPFNFQLPVRAFMKRYATELSGPKKLTLLIAYMARGQTALPVARADVEKHWKKMSGLLGGGYNGAYDTRARDNGWIISPKAGVFELVDGWVEAVEPVAA